MTANLADSEGRNDWLSNRPDFDRPTAGEAARDEAMTSRRVHDRGRLCMRDPDWRSHMTEAEFMACPLCHPERDDDMTITEPGLIHGMPDETYHADPVQGGSLSSTFARLLTEHVPSKANIRRNTFKPSKAMNLGSAAHAHALGTGPELIVWEFDGRTKDGKAERAEKADLIASQAAVGVTAAERDQIEGMVDALRAVPEARQILDASKSEVSAFWREEVGDNRAIWARARYDLLSDDAAYDYKTTVDASSRGFSKAMASYGYHQQAEWYQRGLKALGHAAGLRPLRFICQESEAPYIVQIHEPDEDAMETAEILNDRAVRIYAECMASGVWPGPSRIVNHPTSLPPFYYFDHEDVLPTPEPINLKGLSA